MKDIKIQRGHKVNTANDRAIIKPGKYMIKGATDSGGKGSTKPI